MAGDPKEESAWAEKPEFIIRLFAWLAIYALPQIGFYAYAVISSYQTNQRPSSDGGLGFLLVILFFPIGLWPIAPPVGYVVYLIHLIWTLCVRSWSHLRIALIILLVLLCFNLVGCLEANRQLSHFSP